MYKEEMEEAGKRQTEVASHVQAIAQAILSKIKQEPSEQTNTLSVNNLMPVSVLSPPSFQHSQTKSAKPDWPQSQNLNPNLKLNLNL